MAPLYFSMKALKICLAAMVLLLITSCNKVDNKMESQIPDDAVIVAKIDIPTLISNLKIEVKDGKMVLPEKFAKMLESKGEDFSEDAAKLINSGIDFEHSIYLFAPDSKELSMVALLPLSDPAKLKQFLTEEEKASFESKDGLEVANMGEMAYVIKDDLLYVTNGFKGQDPPTIVNGLLANKKSMGDNASIVRALDAGNDINVYVNTKRVKELTGSEVGKVPNGDMAKMFFDLMDIKCSAFHMNLADGEWNINVENEVDDNGDFMKLVNSITTKPSADLLAFMPKANNMGVLNLNLDGEGILNLDMVKAALGEMGSDPQMAQILDIVKSVKGPVTVGFASTSFNPEDADGALAFKCGKSKELIDLLKQMFPASFYTQNGDEYVLNDKVEGFNATLGVKGDVVYVKMTHKNYTENMASVGEAKDVIGNAMCGAFFSLGVDNMQMQLVHNGKSVKDVKWTMWVKEDGKKLSPLDALTFFDRLSRQVKGL